METRAHHIVIGFFTLALTVAAMVFALWLVKSGSDRERVPYDIVFSDNVTGLGVGSAVMFSGIRVGEVVRLSLDAKDPRLVWTRIRVDRGTPITQATRARMSIANITGASVIHLQNLTPESAPLKAKRDQVAIIPAEPSPFTQLKTSGEELLVNATRLLDNANRMFSTQNSEHLGNILANLDAATATVAGERGSIGAGIRDLAAASAEARASMTQVTGLLTALNRNLDAHGGQLFSNAEDSLAALHQLTATLNSLVSDNRGALGQGVDGLAEIGPLLQELRATITHLGEISRRLEENPGGYLLGRERIKEYQP